MSPVFLFDHSPVIRSEESRKKQHGWKMTQHRIEDTAFSFAPVESRRAGQTNLSWRFFQPIQTSAEATSYLYLAWSESTRFILTQGKGGLASVFARLRWNTVGSASLWLIQVWAAVGSEIRKNRRRRSWFPANFGRIGGPS